MPEGENRGQPEIQGREPASEPTYTDTNTFGMNCPN
jgi:hypothetical protein